ncbi:MAG: Uma2 family endonuclease [Phormidesmis sp.]
MSPVYTPAKLLSFEEYLAYDDGSGRRYELLDTGELVELPYETRINDLLAMALYEYLKQFADWRLFSMNSTAVQVTPITVALPSGKSKRVRQQSRIPDLMVMSELGASQIYEGSSGLALEHDNPRLIVEFVSESNANDDYFDRRSQYEARGVSEYWIADRHQRQVTVLTLKAGCYLEKTYQADEVIGSATFPNAALTAEQVLTVS